MVKISYSYRDQHRKNFKGPFTDSQQRKYLQRAMINTEEPRYSLAHGM